MPIRICRSATDSVSRSAIAWAEPFSLLIVLGARRAPSYRFGDNTWGCGAGGWSHSNGLTMVTGKRWKSESFVITGIECSIAMAARAASETRLPVAPDERSRSERIEAVAAVGAGIHAGGVLSHASMWPAACSALRG